ncbi:hypothetical protein [Sutcliffiella horikoshii]|uniref:Uncharacterized protein n=1 Tax=Sutcliffiella horikoshii TaxID=79883 RepID=A0AA94WPT4_9BACI|nr:hypothetical protein [Sutcliffiella horikoshii]TYS58078.1 hypothetical protein FZC74_13875 [Sutcliffiella horikoshii]
MNVIFRWVVIIFLTFITASLVNKGIDLWSLGTYVDGDGIGVHFLDFEINDRVKEANIHTYAIGFFVASLITLLILIALVGKKILKGNTAVS